MQYANNCNPVRTWKEENKEVVEIHYSPLAHAGQVWMPQCQRRPHRWLLAQNVEAGLGVRQEAVGDGDAGVLGQVGEVID